MNKRKYICIVVLMFFMMVTLLYSFKDCCGDLSSSRVYVQPQPDSSIRKHFLCAYFRGGLGNQIFHFASVYGISRLKNMTMVVARDDAVAKIFNIEVDIRKEAKVCDRIPVISDDKCSFERKVFKFENNKDYRIIRCLQSWRYFIDFEEELRKQLSFKDYIWMKAHVIVKNILSKYKYISRSNVTLVGIHVRRGDKINLHGFILATKEYFQRAVNHYTKHYPNVFFIVASNGMGWCKSNLPKNISIEFLSTKNAAEIDLAVLASCDHVIQSVGTFSWWSAWLAGGSSVFFKWPASEGTQIRNAYSKNFWDHFWPGWIGM